jgi:hypothetical protein
MISAGSYLNTNFISQNLKLLTFHTKDVDTIIWIMQEMLLFLAQTTKETHNRIALL